MPVKLQGIFPALTSSFDYEGKLYKAKVFHNIERLNKIALAGYLVGGSTGETPLLSIPERIQLMEWVREASGDGKVLIAGVGAESVQETVNLANRAAEIGFHFALALTPYYYKIQMHRPDTQALFFRSVADRSKIPVLIYNIPQITGYDVPPEVVGGLSHHPNIAGMKDSSGKLERLAQIMPVVNPGFHVMWGGAPTLWDALQARASGAILAMANAVPYTCVTIWEAFRTREEESGRDWQARMAPAARLIAMKYGVPGLKYAMELNGYYGGPPRLPLVPPTVEAKSEIEAAFCDLKS